MKKRKQIWLIVILGIIVALAVFAIVWGRKVYNKAKQVFAYVDELQAVADADLNAESIQDAIEVAGELSLAIDDLREDVDPMLPLARGLGKLPRVGGYFNNVEPLLDFSSNIVKAVVILGRTAQPIIQDGFTSSEMGQLQVLYEFFTSNQSNFKTAEAYLDDAQLNWRQIDPEYIPERFKDEISTIDKYMQISTTMFDVLEVVPDLLGSDDHETYLIMIQNKDELRPSGGFITGFGVLQLRAGRILALRIDDSTSFDYVSELRDPALPIKELMFAEYLVPRDANWSPDFPTAALETQEIYKLSTGLETDAIIAFDQIFLSELFGFIGPMTFSDEIGEINGENFESKMIEYKQLNWEDGTIQERKEFLSILAPELIDAIFKKNEFSDLVELGKIALEQMETGHLSLYFNDPEIQKIVESRELDSAVRTGNGDYLMLVDSNIGFGKIDQYIDRSLDYSVDLSDLQEPKGNLIVAYQHTGSKDERCFQGRRLHDKDLRFANYYFSRCYWDYWRILLPQGTVVEDIQSTKVPLEYFHENMDENWDQTPVIGEGISSTVEAGGLIVVPQSSEQTVQITTKLPPHIVADTGDGRLVYSLSIQKENGIDYLPVRIRVTLPNGYEPINMDDGWIFDKSPEKIATWEGVIDRTTDFVLELIAESQG